MAAGLMGSLPVLLIVGLYFNRISAERKALASESEPSLNPDYWVLGGMFYRNPNDPRTMVPKPPHTGVGMTFQPGVTRRQTDGGSVTACRRCNSAAGNPALSEDICSAPATQG